MIMFVEIIIFNNKLFVIVALIIIFQFAKFVIRL